jgi:hypothetical protein
MDQQLLTLKEKYGAILPSPSKRRLQPGIWGKEQSGTPVQSKACTKGICYIKVNWYKNRGKNAERNKEVLAKARPVAYNFEKTYGCLQAVVRGMLHAWKARETLLPHFPFAGAAMTRALRKQVAGGTMSGASSEI